MHKLEPLTILVLQILDRTFSGGVYTSPKIFPRARKPNNVTVLLSALVPLHPDC